MPNSPEVSPVDSEEDHVYDSEDGLEPREDKEEEEEEDDDFEDQASSNEDKARLGKNEDKSESEDEVALSYESETRSWKPTGQKRADEQVAAILLSCCRLTIYLPTRMMQNVE